MDKYIKLDDLLELIKETHKRIEKDYKNGCICFSSKIAMDGTLESLRQDITK